jgi:hypothetical protein
MNIVDMMGDQFNKKKKKWCPYKNLLAVTKKIDSWNVFLAANKNYWQPQKKMAAKTAGSTKIIDR